MNQTNAVTGADIAIRLLIFCTLLIGGTLVLTTYNETEVADCGQIVTQETEQSTART